MTKDGDKTWDKLKVSLPEQYEDEKTTALSPAWMDDEFILPVVVEPTNEIVRFVWNVGRPHGIRL